ncbi:unnamed protein product, partial [Durusdinium trenchii]
FFLKDLAEVLEEESVEASSDQKGTDGVSPRMMRKKGTPTQARAEAQNYVDHIRNGFDGSRKCWVDTVGKGNALLTAGGIQSLGGERVCRTLRGKLTDKELWTLQGRAGLPRGENEGDFGSWIVEGTKATGIRTATSLLTVGGYILFMVDQQGTKAGMCRGVQGAEAMAQILVWLRRWKRGELRRAGGHLNPLCRWAESWWLDILEGDLSEEEPGDLGHGCYA